MSLHEVRMYFVKTAKTCQQAPETRSHYATDSDNAVHGGSNNIHDDKGNSV